MWEFNTKAVGVTFENRQENVKALKPGYRIFWKHEPLNKYDANAIALYSDPLMKNSIGHLSKAVAKNFVKRLKVPVDQEIFVEKVTGGVGTQSFGVNLKVMVHGENKKARTK